MHVNLVLLVFFKLFKECSGSQLFGLLFTFCLSSPTKLTVYIGINVKNTLVMSRNTVFWQRYICNLTVLHEMILEVIINHDGIQIDKIGIIIDSKNELFCMKETQIHVNRTNERLKDILKDLWVIIPAISHSLLIHENHIVETQLGCYFGEGL